MNHLENAIILIILLTIAFAYLIYRIFLRRSIPQQQRSRFSYFIWPAITAIFAYAIHKGTEFFILITKLDLPLIHTISKYLSSVLIVLSLLWLLRNIIKLTITEVQTWLRRKDYQKATMVMPAVEKSSTIIIILIFINIVVPYFGIGADYRYLIEKFSNIVLIISLTLIAMQLVSAFSKVFLTYYPNTSTDIRSKKIITHVSIIRKIINTLIVILGISSILMLFDKFRELGTTLLASAGIVAAIGTIAAQRVITGLFAGMVIAITQPIRINDQVIVENEFGTIEEIKLTYVVVRIWDSRRMVLPISYFIEKPFQNWTYNLTNLVGNVILYLDYHVQLEKLRNQFKLILENSLLWDRAVSNFQVVNFNKETMEVRLLASAADAGRLFDLCCELREKMMDFIQREMPESLPKFRIESGPISLKNEYDTSR